MTQLNVKKIKNYTEKMWFLGTDILQESDWALMDKQVKTAFCREYGAIYSVGKDFIKDYKKQGYSKEFQNIMKEALSRGYSWIFFDRDINTSFKK